MQPRVPAMARLLAVHRAISDLAETAPDILARPAVANALEQSLLQAAIGSVSDTETADSQRAWRRSVMVRFENYLEANPDQPLHVIDVCAAVGVSERTLRMHCQAHLGVGPQRYLWLRRMNQVRRSLALADPAEKTVTQIATDYGFWELGRFSVSYRNLFGERPSVTLGRPADMKSPTV